MHWFNQNTSTGCPLSFETGGTMGYNCCFFLNFVPLHIESPYNFGGTGPILGVKNPLQRVNGHAAIGYTHLYICIHKCLYEYYYISRSAKYSMQSLSSWYLDPFYQQSKLDLLLGPSWLWLYGSWVFNYLCNQCLLPLKLWVWTSFMARCTRYNIMR
jgi:hypothetical protein